MDSIKAWEAMCLLEKGLKHHHSHCCTIQMEKPFGSKALPDEENNKVFCSHFNKIFDNHHPLPCNITVLDLITPCPIPPPQPFRRYRLPSDT
eukprot:4764663-Ditylum_brightwellii.AAC.1